MEGHARQVKDVDFKEEEKKLVTEEKEKEEEQQEPARDVNLHLFHFCR